MGWLIFGGDDLARSMLKVGIECESIEERETWGVGRIINRLLAELAQRPELQKEFKFFLYFKSKIPDHPYLASPLFTKRIVRLPFLPLSFSLYYYFLLPVRLYFENLDLMYFPNYMLPIISRGRSLVTLTEDIHYEMSFGNLPLRYRLAYRVFANWAAKHATSLMAMSESSKKNIADLFKISPDRISVNHLGIDLPFTNYHLPITNYQLPITNYLFYVGQAFPRRHLRETILAFEEIAPQFSDLQFIAIGKDKYNPPIIAGLVESANRRLGREAVIHKDYVSDAELIDLYTKAKCLVYVSSKEAFGLPPLEAALLGTAPVVSLEGATKEILGDGAIYVDNPDSVDQIAQAMAKALTANPDRLVLASRTKQILDQYSWRAHADRFLAIIRSLVNNAL